MTVAQRQGQSCKYDIMLDEEHFDIDEFVAEANKWDDVYLHSTIHAVELYHRQSQVREIILKFLSRKNRAAFKLTNPFSKRIWLRELLSAFLSDPKRPETQHEKEYGRVGMMTGLKRGLVACALVTFTDENWACPDTAIEFDLNRAKQKVRNALNGLSFVAAFEAAHYVNENGRKTGKGANWSLSTAMRWSGQHTNRSWLGAGLESSHGSGRSSATRPGFGLMC